MLSDDLSRYIELHQQLGFQFRLQACLLRHFVAFAELRSDTFVRSETALAWAAKAPSIAQRRDRLAVVCRFARRMHIEDERYEIPPPRAFGKQRRRRRTPHVYAPDEIARLLGAAAKLGPVDSIRGATFVALFALLACTGLRICEALALRVDDVTPDGLVIRHTKFRKSRLVPLHPTAREGLKRYLVLRGRRCDPCIFLSQWDKPFTYQRVNAIFLELMRSIGLRGPPGTKGPHIHDLRHTFAVRALESSGGNEDEVTRHILALSTYLGHTHPSDTYWYLQATPRLMADIADAGESHFAGSSP